MASPSQAEASPARTPATRRTLRMEFMTVSIGSECDLSTPTVTGPAARPPSVVLPMPRPPRPTYRNPQGEDRHEHFGDRQRPGPARAGGYRQRGPPRPAGRGGAATVPAG